MNPKDKAIELVNKFQPSCAIDLDAHPPTRKTVAKYVALITVDEILEATPFSPHQGNYYETSGDRFDEAKEYWEQVKNEINNL